MGVDFLGEIPLEMAIREGSDTGRPIVANEPSSPQANAYHAIADALWKQVSEGTGQKVAPEIIVE